MMNSSSPNKAKKRKKPYISILASDASNPDFQSTRRLNSQLHAQFSPLTPKPRAAPLNHEGTTDSAMAMEAVPPAVSQKKTSKSREERASRKRPVVISNLTISHALIEAPSCYYEGSLPPIDFDLDANDILIAPQRLIKCDHAGTLQWIQQFPTVLHFYINFPRKRELVIHNLVRQLPGNVYVLQDQEWELVIHQREQLEMFQDIVENLVEYKRQRRTALPISPLRASRQEGEREEELIVQRNSVSTTKLNQTKTTDSHACKKGGGVADEEVSHEYWTGLQDDYLPERDRMDQAPNELCENDVLLSQRALWEKHFGTVWFGHLMRQSLERTDSLDQIAKDLVRSVLQRGGCFFERSPTADSTSAWRMIKHWDKLLGIVQGLLKRMQRMETHAVGFPVEGVQTNDVILAVSPTFFNHYGTSWFVNIMLRIKNLFISAEVGHVLARKIREEVVSRGGRFFVSKPDDPIDSLKMIEGIPRIELSIVRLLEYMELIDMKHHSVKTVEFDYPASSRRNLDPLPNHSDVFLASPWLRLANLETKPPGNIRLMRMVQDRCELCPQVDWTGHATDVIFRVHSQQGRFLLQHPETGWHVEKDIPNILPLVISSFEDVAKTRPRKDISK